MNHFCNILYVSEPTIDQDSAFARAVTLAERNLSELAMIEVLPPPIG